MRLLVQESPALPTRSPQAIILGEEKYASSCVLLEKEKNKIKKIEARP